MPTPSMNRLTIGSMNTFAGTLTLIASKIAWSLFKRSLIGSYHKVSAKHLDAYLDEFELAL